nr:PREDICTED: condensin complex subunit 1 isoform X2 [Linepithema humile]
MTLANICYKILEQSKEAKQKQTRQTIFEVLGTLIKKYNHGLTSVVRIIQLVKLYDALAIPIAVGVVHMTTECSCNGLLREMMNEIGHNDIGETHSRNISIFLENIAISQPDLIIPILDDITEYLSNDFYTMRNCVIGVMGAVVQKALNGEDLTSEQKEKRDECLNLLEEHILDCNAYVRSKVLQTWQRLCCEGAVPIARHAKLLAATTLRLEDKSANVRKQALQLLRALLQSNPFAGKLNCDELSKTLKEEKAKLQELQSQLASNSGRGHAQRFELWTALESDIKAAIKKIIKNDEAEDEDDTDTEDEENIDPNHMFEHIRQLLLNRKVTAAVKYLWTTCTKLKENPEMENLSAIAKEECLFTFLLKIFIESEDDSLENENGDAVNNADKLNQVNKMKEDINKRKRIINYLNNCLEFATKLEDTIPMAKRLLFSTCASDAVESCTFLGIAFQFGVTGAADCMRETLFQAFHRDQSVRNNLAAVYKEIYLTSDDKKSTRQIAVTRANHLINLMKKLQPGQSPALTQLIVTWYKNEELNSELLQVLWEKFCLKYSGTSPIDSRTALMILTMIAQAEPDIVTDNLNILVTIGLGPRAKDDLLLARDTCRMLLKIKQNSRDVEKAPLRYPNDHDIFREILILLIDTFTSVGEKTYISFATDAINVIYHLANQSDQLIKKLLLDITEKGQFTNREASQEPIVSCTALSKLLYVVGHVAIRQMIHLDVSIYKELKRRNAVREMRGKRKKRTSKNVASTSHRDIRGRANRSFTSNKSLSRKDSSMISTTSEDNGDNGEEALEGAMDDAEAEFVNGALENEIVTGDGLLAKFIPLVLDVCQYPDKYNNDENVQAAGSLALSKMMTVSSEFCEQSLQLLVTILERSPYSGIRSNMLIGLSDLATRFPNQVEPWSKHIYGRLRDNDINVRRTCVRMLSNLIMREMIRVKGQVSELALCIIDEDEQIRQETKEFFNHLSQKGNTLYNIMPDILSRLADPELNLNEKQFQETIRYILGLMQKERQIDTIIDKICARFKLAATERQWRDLSYCLSLLQFSGKSIRRLIESLPLLKEKIHHKPVLTVLQNIIEQTKKKADAKAACAELEEKIQELLETETENSEVTDQILMPPPNTVPQTRKNVYQSRRKNKNYEDNDSSDDSEEDANNTPVKKKLRYSVEKARSKRISRSRSIAKYTDDDSDDDNNDDSALVTPVSVKHGKRERQFTEKKKVTLSSGSDSNASPITKKNKINKSPQITPKRTSTRLRK